MAPRARKRVHALRRGPDGSAFQKCEYCGISVAIALFDMHGCGRNGGVKRSRRSAEGLGIRDQPRSPFCCFMESFSKTCKAENWMEIDQRGFNTWKNMSKKERYLYVVQAEKVNSAYLKILLEESNNMSEVDDEADSAMVGKFDPELQGYKDPLAYNSSVHWEKYKWPDCFDSYDWDMLGLWLDGSAFLEREDQSLRL